ncbi:MAG: RsmE family RNA methyltransferase [Pseudomonadota bacterium]
MRRFFLPSLLDNGKIFPDTELLHRVNDVLRLKDGDTVEFIDGEGLIVEAKAIKNGKAFEEIKRTNIDRPKQKICIAAAMIRRERFDILVEKAVELGADEIIPVVTERSRPFSKDSYKKLCEKWQKTADQALSQCKRVFRCMVLDVCDLKTVCEIKGHGTKIAFHPEGRSLTEIKFSSHGNALFLIGPEGGFSKDEVDTIKKNGIELYALTDNILRTETAVFYILSICNFNSLKFS